MNVKEVLKELESYGHEGTKKTLLKHGAKEPFWGVKVQDLKKIQKKVKTDHELSLALFETGNSDAMYLAGLIADKTKINKATLNKWAKQAYWSYLSEYTVPWITSETKYGMELGLKWIESPKENIASCGWATLSSVASLLPDEDLDKSIFKKALKSIPKVIVGSGNRVKYTMNGFVIAVGSYIPALHDEAMRIAEKIGPIAVEMNGTACKVPLATQYILKMKYKGNLGKKRKSARC